MGRQADRHHGHQGGHAEGGAPREPLQGSARRVTEQEEFVYILLEYVPGCSIASLLAEFGETVR